MTLSFTEKNTNMLSIFRIKKEERYVALLMFIIMIAFEAMMVYYKFGDFTRYERVGFWSLFYNRMGLSGFDPYSYIIISEWRPIYPLYRHPLLSVMFYPLSVLNGWLIPHVGFNCATTIIAVIWVVMNTYSYIFMYRVFRRGLKLTCGESLLLNILFFSLGYIMVTMVVPEHMTMTFFMLSMTLWIATRAIIENRQIKRWQTMLLGFITTGITTTIISKVVIADAVAHWRRTTFKRFVKNMLTYLIPLALIIALVCVQEVTTEQKERDHQKEMSEKIRKKDPAKYERQQAEHRKDVAETGKKQVGGGFLFAFTNTSIDPLQTLTDNMFGESLIIHRDHLFEDVHQGRPVFVDYNSPIEYLFEAIIVAMLIAGAWLGRRNRVLLITLGWFATDIFLHIIMCFAIDEVYIMTAHWAFVIPVAIGCIMAWSRNKGRWMHRSTLILTAIVTAFLLIHNGTLLVTHLLK